MTSAPSASSSAVNCSGGVPSARDAVVAGGELRDHGLVRDGADAADGGAELGDVAEGLEHEQVDAGLGERLGLLAERRFRFVQTGLAPRLDAHAERADGAGDVGLAARRLAGDAHTRGVDLTQPLAEAEGPQLQPVGAERVGFEDVGPGPHVGLMDLGDEIRLGEIQLVEGSVEEDALAVEHRPHRAVADQDTRVERVEEPSHAFADAVADAAGRPAADTTPPGAGTSRSCLSQMKSLLL